MAPDDKVKIRLFNTVEPVTTFYRDIIPYLESKGWSVEVFISRSQYRKNRGRDWSSSNTEFNYSPNFGINLSGPLGRIIVNLSFICYATLVTLFGKKADINLFLTQPPLFYIWGALLQLLRNQPYYIVLMDVYPEILDEAGVLSRKSLIFTFLSKVARFGLMRADGVIAIGRCMRQWASQIGIAANKLHIIQNWVDQEVVVRIKLQENELRQKMGWQDKFIVMYSGNIGVSHFFDDVLQVARELQSNKRILFVFIGNGQRRLELQNYKDRYELDNIQLLAFQPQEQLSTSLGSGNIHFISLRPGFTGLVVPSKAYGVMAAGRPIIYQGESWGEIARMINEEEIGHTVPVDNWTELKNTVLRYAQDDELVFKQGIRARQVLENKYSKDQALKDYFDILSTKVTIENQY